MSPPSRAEPPIPAPGDLRRSVSWPAAVLVASGTAFLVTVSLGPMAPELGAVSPLVWAFTAAVGALQCLLIAELASLLPARAGGTATYAQEALRRVSPLLGAVSSWAYWFAWTPGIVVNLILAADYLRHALQLDADPLPIALVLAASLYGLNALGLRTSMRVSAVAALLALGPLVAMAVGLLLRPSLVRAEHLSPFAVPGHPWTALSAWKLLLKWTFVAAWSSYGAEIASTVVAEMQDARTRIPYAMIAAAVTGLLAFGLVPVMLLAAVGAQGLGEDPLVVFLPLARAVFGDHGNVAVGLMLGSALVLGAQAFIVGSSRTVFQMTRDRHLPSVFARVNRRGVPIGSIVWDAAVILTLLLVFGGDVVDVVAAANVGYLLVFVLLPIAYLSLRAHHLASIARPFTLPPPFAAVAVALAAFNALVLVVGGAQWGAKVLITGTAVTLLIVPLSLATRWRAGAISLTDEEA